MGTQIEWKTCTDENFFTKVNPLSGTRTTEHPLKTTTVTERIPRRILGSLPSTGRTTPVSTPSLILEPLSMALEGVDPLTAFQIEEMDPLSKLAAEETVDGLTQDKQIVDTKTELDSWNVKKTSILSKYTTSEKISIVTSFLSDGEKVVVKAQSTAVDKMQHRLEQLDCIDEGSQTKLDLSQAEYVNRIEQLNRELVSAWNTEQRVKALKIAIQCAKLLADTTVLNFYPSKFVLITDILDVFGQLVYNRLSTKTETHKSKTTKLPEDFTPDMVSDSTKETCLNWFYKIASIRELVPRLYVELALIKSYFFLSLSECEDALRRISHMISGVGNPLVAVYARCYLARVGCSLSNRIKNKQYLQQNFHRFLQSYQHLFSRSVKAELTQEKISLSVYMSLFTPALDYILQTVATLAPDSSDHLLEELLERCRVQNSSLILNTIMSAFKPVLISNRTVQFLDMIEKCQDQGIPLHSLLRTLGLCVSVAPPPFEHRRQVLGSVWRYITALKNTEDYVSCVEPWILYVVKYFTHREINTILGDIIEHVGPDRSYEQYYNQLKHVVDNIVVNVQDLEALLVMDHFLPLIDLFQEESARVEVCKKILVGFNSNIVNDPVIVNALMFLCSVLHDSVNALTPEDENRQIGEILCHVIRIIDYGRDFEQQLTFYVEARGMFSNIDIVFVQLVQCVNALSVTTRQIVKGVHTRKTSDFVRACAAYSYITIPSIKSVKQRLKLYLLSGQVALFNHCLGQADACFKGAINTLAEEGSQVPESEIVNFVKQFLAVLLVVPDNPDCSVLALTRMFLNVLQGYQWEGATSLIMAYLSCVDMLSVMALESYPYHIDKVESNDSLYGSDKKFISEVNKVCTVVMSELVNRLQTLGPCTKQSSLAIELLVKVAVRNELTNQMMVLALNLWSLAKRDSTLDKKYLTRTREYLKRKSFSTNNIKLQELVEKMD